jgi:hypothetical protein
MKMNRKPSLIFCALTFTGVLLISVMSVHPVIAAPVCNVPDPPPICEGIDPPDTPPTPTLQIEGIWRANDGGTYYLRQIGNTLWWYGESSPTNPFWTNVFVGTVQNNEISGSWADVPKGGAQGSGVMTLKVFSNKSIKKISGSPNFGGSVWSR